METSISERFLGILLSSIVLQHKTIWRRTSGRHGTGALCSRGRYPRCLPSSQMYRPASVIERLTRSTEHNRGLGTAAVAFFQGSGHRIGSAKSRACAATLALFLFGGSCLDSP